jgi:hypothetical protein
MQHSIQCVLFLSFIPCVNCFSSDVDRIAAVEERKHAFLVQLADHWIQAGYPIHWKHEEWKFDEIEPHWSGALAALRLARSPAEIAQANTFFSAMPLDEKIDPDMRVCEALHAYYLFRDDPNLTSAARKRLFELVHFKPAPRRIHPSIWKFGTTENHALMGHVWCLLVAQIDRDWETAEAIGQHIDTYIGEHIKKGWLEYNSPCYVEKEVGCLIMLTEWAEDPLPRRKAALALDVLFAEHAVLNLEGMLGGPACRVYRAGNEGILPVELGHNSRCDAKCSGSYPIMYMLFGQGERHFYGVLGAPLLATSRYLPPVAVHGLATAGSQRGAYEFKARRPGHACRLFRSDPNADQPLPEMFNGCVYAWVTPDYVLGSFQEVQGKYGALRSLPLTSVLRMAGSSRRAIYTDTMLGGRKEMAAAVVDCVQHKNVSMGRGSSGQAYFATEEFEEVVEKDGWIFVRAGETFATYRVIGAGYTWQHVDNAAVYGDFIKFDNSEAPFVLEAAQASDYSKDFLRFQADVLDNRIEQKPQGLVYESCSAGDKGPSAEVFVLTLRYRELPLVNGTPINLGSYNTFDSPYLNSPWDSGIVRLQFGPNRLTINVARSRSPLRIEERICPLLLPYETNCNKSDTAWVPFLNYWRLKPEQWYWDHREGRSGGCLRHDSGLGVQERERGAHDAAILLRGGEQWTDYNFEVDAYAKKGHFGLWVRADMHDEGGGNGRWVQGYYFVLDPSHKKCRLWRARQDGLVVFNKAGEHLRPEINHFSNPLLLQEAEIPNSVTYGCWLHLRITVCGKVITCFVNGKQVLRAANALYPSGTVGLIVYKGQDVRFDNMRVASLQPEEY